jgi:hypothetical protein
MQGENDVLGRSLSVRAFLCSFVSCSGRLRRLYTSFTLSTLPQRAAAWYG